MSSSSLLTSLSSSSSPQSSARPSQLPFLQLSNTLHPLLPPQHPNSNPPSLPSRSADCKLRTSACLTACQNPFATPPISSISNCQTACTYVLGSTCGTGSQAIPLYKVDKFDDIPKCVPSRSLFAWVGLMRSRYYADTSVGGVAQGITTAGAPGRGPFAVLLLGAIGGAVMVLR